MVDALAELRALDGNSFGFVKVVLSLNAGLRITCSFLVVGIFFSMVFKLLLVHGHFSTS